MISNSLASTWTERERGESVGQAAKDEVYRWQSEIANGRRDVLKAQAAVKKAKVALNRVLNRPLNDQFYTKEATLDDPQLITSHQRLYPYIANPRNFDLFRDFQVQEGVAAAPELRRVVALMEGKARELLNGRASLLGSRYRCRHPKRFKNSQKQHHLVIPQHPFHLDQSDWLVPISKPS